MDVDQPPSPVCGAAAPHDQNWNPATSDTRVVNQAFQLPKASTVELNKILPPLDSSESFDKWHDAVISALKDQNLHNLVNIEIPRPFRDDVNAKIWYRLSQEVASFLESSVDSALVKAIKKPDITFVFADDFMAALRNHLLGKGHSSVQKSAFDVWEAKRSDYDTTGAFLRAMKRKLARGMRDHAVKPWDAYIVASRELAKWPELELAIYRYHCDTSKSQLPDDVTRADFEGFCGYIMNWEAQIYPNEDFGSDDDY